MSVQAAEPMTYAAQQRELIRIILACEAEKIRLQIQLLELHIELMITLDREARERLQELIEALKDEIEAVKRLEEAARATLGKLHRDHRGIYESRQRAPDGGAEKHWY